MSEKIRKLSWKEILKLCKTSFIEFFKDDSFTHGAALAYYAIFALVPIIYLAITIFGAVVGEEVMIEIIQSLLQQNIGIEDVSGITGFMKQLNLGQGSWIMKIIGGVVLLFSSTAILNALKNSINNFFDIDRVAKKNVFVHNLLSRATSLGILSVFGIVIIITYFAEMFILSLGKRIFPDSDAIDWFFFNIIEHGLVVLVNVVLFAFIFKYLHDGRVRWKLAWAGSLFTSILLYLGQLLIKYYLINYFFAKGAGVAGTLLVILTWMFYSSQIIFLGAKFTAVYARMIGKPIVAK